MLHANVMLQVNRCKGLSGQRRSKCMENMKNLIYFHTNCYSFLISSIIQFHYLSNKTWQFNISSIHVLYCVIKTKYTHSNKNPSAWYFVRPAQAVTYGTVAIIIRVVLLSPYLRIRGVSLSSIHYNQSRRVYINRRQQHICLIWN